MPSGKCEECLPYTKVTDSKKACAAELCNYKQKLLANGACDPCPAYQVADKKNLKECRNKECYPNQRTTEDSDCQDCPEYQRGQGAKGIHQDFKIECGSDVCNGREQLLIDGKCKAC